MLISTGMLLQCTADEPSTPPAVNGWIEYPLSEHTYSASNTPFLHSHHEVPVPAGEALEHKLRLNEGDTIVYLDMMLPGPLEVEFHSHTDREPGADDLLMFYNIHRNGQERGALTAPFSGIHGWYLNNRSAVDIVVHLEVAGFYAVEP
ncbi:hypothetical protein E3V39_03635 [Gammaproteobacteria bacterium LSUCC0112]|nr:hypothetical protein E3V39_03635 [Gammaproteobacteria bacterium LSUCC0112]